MPYTPNFQAFNTAAAPSQDLGLQWGGYFPAFANQGGNAYNGFGMTMQGPYAGYLRAPGAGNAAGVARANSAFEEARRQNLINFNQVGGFNDVLNQLPMRTVSVTGGGTGIAGIGGGRHGTVQEVQIGGQWKRLDQLTPADTAAINQMIARNSQFEPMMGGYYGRYARGMNDVAGIQNLFQNRQGQAVGQANALAKAVNAGYAERLKTGMGLAGAGFDQARNDIHSQFDNAARGAIAHLTDIGLSNSTVQDAVLANLQAQRGKAIGELTDQMVREQQGMYGTLSGQQLQAQQSLGQLGLETYLGTSRDVAAAQELGLQTDMGASRDMLEWAGSLKNTYPQYAPYGGNGGLGYGSFIPTAGFGGGGWGNSGTYNTMPAYQGPQYYGAL